MTRSGFDGGFWRVPRWLRDELDDGHLTATQFALIVYLATAGADREGAATRYADLSARFGVSQRTIERSLTQMRDRGLLRFTIKPGQRTPFRVTLGARLEYAPPTSRPTSPPTTQGGSVSEVTSDKTSVTTSDTATISDGQEPLNHAGLRSDTTSDTTSDTGSDSRVRAETETEIEKTNPLLTRGEKTAPESAPLRCCAPPPETSCRLTFRSERELREHLLNVHFLDDRQIDDALRARLTVITGAAA